MKKLYFQDITVAFLLLVSQFSIAQDKLTPNPANLQSEHQSLMKVQPVATDQYSINGRFDIQLSKPLYDRKFDTDQVPLSHSFTRIENVAPALKSTSTKLSLKENSNGKMVTGLTFDCDGTPVGFEDNYAVAKDDTLTVDAPGLMTNDIDPNGDMIIVSNYFPPSHGTLTSIVTNGKFVYVPDDDFVGIDTFQYTLLDAEGIYSDPVIVTIEVFESFNRNPIGISDHYGTSSNDTLTVDAPGLMTNDLDPDGDMIIVSNYFPPSHGTLTSIVTNGKFVYVPDDGFVGIDTFQYTLRDAESNFSDPVTVIIQVFESFNRKPIGISDHYGTSSGDTLTVDAPGLMTNDLDPDGDMIIVSNYFPPSHGTLTSIVTNGKFVYVPDDGFVGIDTFQYTLRDAESNFSDPVTVTLEVVASGGSLPLGFEDAFAVETDETLTVDAPGLMANDFDPDGDMIIVSNYFPPSHGTLTSIVTNGKFVYVPDDGFVGIDTFQYTLQDVESNFSDPVTVTIQVFESFNRNPIGISDQYGTTAGTSLEVDAPGLMTNDLDPDGDMIIVSNYFPPSHGTLTSIVTNGKFVYVPDDGFVGIDTFQYTLRDAESNFSDPVIVIIQVFESFNRNPIGISDHYGTSSGDTLTVDAPGLMTNDLDPDGDMIIVSNYFPPSHGTLTSIVTNGKFVYVPDDGFVGIDTFQYTLRDAENNFSDPVMVTLEVVAPYLPPVASAADITAECDGTSGTAVTLDGSATTATADAVLQYTWYENGVIIAGPSALPTAEVILSTDVHSVTLLVEDECGNTSSDNATITIEDTSAPLVEAAFLSTDKSNEFEIFCSSEDLCSGIISSMSVIRIPKLNNPSVSLNNNKNYSLVIDVKKKTVDVKAPDAAAFWAMIMTNGGVEVNNGQVIKAKYDKNKFKFSFDSEGNLVSVEGNIVTLLCTATDSHGNTGEGEATLPSDFLRSLDVESQLESDRLKSMTSETIVNHGNEVVGWHRNYPNPFVQKTTIEYQLETPAFVTVSVYDQTGRKIQELSGKQMPAGVQEISWDAANRNPGIYYYRIVYNENQLTGKMLLLGK